MATAKSEISDDTNDFSIGFDGFFCIEASKVVSITPEQPLPGWVTLGFSDESDAFSLNAQMFYVPAPLFERAVEQYLASKQPQG